MVDSCINSPNVDPEAYPTLLETIQTLGRGYRSFNERSSNFLRPTELHVIPGIHVPLQVDDSACRGANLGQGDSPNETADLDSEQEGRAEKVAAGAQASTSAPSGEPPNTSGAGGTNAPRGRRETSTSFPHC